jgi:subtilisin family serine protease
MLRVGAEEVHSVAARLRKRNFDVVIARPIEHEGREPTALTNELVVRFADDVTPNEARRLAHAHGLKITRSVRHAGNAFLLVGDGDPSYGILTIADALMASGRVVYVEPNLLHILSSDVYVPNDPLWAQLPHLTLINVDDVWDRLDDAAVTARGGSPTITIGVVDGEGVAPNHPDLTANLTDGTSKLVSSTNFAASPIAAQTVAGLFGDHGTSCAASACAAFDENRGLPGVAPNCHLIGAQIGSVSAVAMADLYMWMAGFWNGSTAAGFPTALPTRPADVISSSFGLNGAALSNTTRDLFDFLTTYGRGGKGVVLCFSLGNTGYLDYTNPTGSMFRAWSTYVRTLGVGASINTNPTNPVAQSSHADHNGNTINIATAVDTRALYSPFGATALRKPDLVAPSHTAYGPALIDTIVSAVRVGTGNIDGCPGLPTCNDYRSWFGGTSHATPTVAGAVALLLSARPSLNWVQVREILRRSCVRIDAGQSNAIGQWQDLDGDGLIDHSRWYGAGRLDVDAAVALALDPTLPLADIYVRENIGDAGDVPSTGTWYHSPDIWTCKDPATAIPSLAWTAPPPHEDPERGHDNALFCRVKNRGTGAAQTVYVRAMITHFPGVEFQYPADFEPSHSVGAPVPSPLARGTYLIGEAMITDLAPGEDTIVKINWPAALIPPATVMVGSTVVQWHPCLLLEATPHDGPEPVGGLDRPVQGDNNIAQRNLTIVDSDSDSDSDAWVAVGLGTHTQAGVATLVLDATQLRGRATLRLACADMEINRTLAAAVRRAVTDLGRPATKSKADCGVWLEQPTRLRVRCGDCDVVVVAAAGSRVISSSEEDRELEIAEVTHRGIACVEVRGLSGRLEVPLMLPPERYVLLVASLGGEARGDLRITQRRSDGIISPGYGIRRR